MEIDKKVLVIFLLILGASISLSIVGTYYIYDELNPKESKKWTEEFNIEDCTFSTTGNNTYFILEIGYQLILEGIDEGDLVLLNITVLNETEMVGIYETRVVQEAEYANGELIEISRNFFAFCEETKSVFYFGEDVDIYEDGVVALNGSEAGAWRAFEGDNRPGIMMPGQTLIGARYYQEIAPGVAMDRAEIMDNNATITVPVGTFEGCLIIRETNPVEPDALEYKYHAPGIGLIIDEMLELIQFGFI
ncbi:MAG: hypothetical protein ACFE8L_05320 [Candidatus Hodarchaeota archaeon]